MAPTTVSAAQFAATLNVRQCTVIDLRTDAEYCSEHIAPSIRLPSHRVTQANLKSALQQAGGAENDTIYLLCQSGMRAFKAIEQLGNLAPLQLCVIEGGLDQLKLEGVATTSSGKRIISLERQVRITAGLLVVIGVLLSHFVHPNFIALTTFVGAGLIFAGVTNTCTMALLLARMPWNQT